MSNISSNVFFPASFSITAIDGPNALQISSSLLAIPAASYWYWIQLTGPSAHEYLISYSSGRTEGGSFVVHNSDQEPAAPALSSAVFSSDGSSFTISFDSNTDRGGTPTFFTCSRLFTFSCSNITRCQWIDNQNIIAYSNGGGGCVAPGDYLSIVKTAAIKAMCQDSSGICPTHFQWKNCSSNPVSIRKPLSPTVPIVVITSPRSIGACDNLTIDISSSSGNGGRQWASVSITVEGSPGSSADQLQAFLAERMQSSSLKHIPHQLITKGFEYSFMVKMCNFLGVCNEASQTVSAIDTSIPLVVIPGAALVTVARNSFLKVQSSVSVSSCLSSSSSASVSYSWSIWTNNSAAELKSISKDASKFILPPYSLQVKSFYTVTLTASIVGHANSASASISVKKKELYRLLHEMKMFFR